MNIDPKSESILESSISILGGTEVARQTVYAIYALGKFDGAVESARIEHEIRQDYLKNT